MLTEEKIALNTCLVYIQYMLQDMKNKSLSDIYLPLPNIQREKCIQNLFMDTYVSKEDDLLHVVAKEFFEANYQKLNPNQNHVFQRIKN